MSRPAAARTHIRTRIVRRPAARGVSFRGLAAACTAATLVCVGACSSDGSAPVVLPPASSAPVSGDAGSTSGGSVGADSSPGMTSSSSDAGSGGSGSLEASGQVSNGDGPTAGDGGASGALGSGSATASSGSTESSTTAATTARTTGSTNTSTGAASTTTRPALPPQYTVTLSKKLVINVTVPDSVDVSGVDIQGAIEAYKNLVRLGDEAGHDPKSAWQDKFRRYAVDPAESALMDDLASYRSDGVHAEGHASYQAEVVAASPDAVTLNVCVDNTGVDVVNAAGRSVKAGYGGRHPQPTDIIRDGSGSWFVKRIAGVAGKSC